VLLRLLDTEMIVGPHPVTYVERPLERLGIASSQQLKKLRDGSTATVVGHVKGAIFLTLEDETGNSNVIVFHDF
jgi:hypothetical protein